MSNAPRNGGDAGDHDARLRDLEAKLDKLTPRPAPEGQMASYDQAHVAWRMVTELVAGIGLGFGIGFGLDHLFGTTPFLMILFIFLGLAAGIKTMMRSAAELGSKPGAAPGTDKRD